MLPKGRFATRTCFPFIEFWPSLLWIKARQKPIASSRSGWDHSVRQAGEDLTRWLEYCAEGLRLTLEKAWLRIQSFQMSSSQKLVLRPRQEKLLNLLRDQGSMAPGEIWQALDVSRQGAMDLLRP